MLLFLIAWIAIAHRQEAAQVLVIARRINEEIHLQIPGRRNPVVIMPVRLGLHKVRLSIEADSDIEISRPVNTMQSDQPLAEAS